MTDLPENRHHRTTTTATASLFICFTSRLSSSSSSMKLPSKSIPSPGRPRDNGPAPTSLSTSLSRRLKSNGSLKAGHQSPMFPPSTGAKRRGFENPEPSSPKVTCIGQVRVKTKKQGNKIKTLSKRRKTNNHFAAFTSGANNQLQQQQDGQPLADQHRNQRWVHLPLTICEALRKGCLFPCRPPSCLRQGREKGRKGSCGVVLVSLDEEGKEVFDDSGVQASFWAPRMGGHSEEVEEVSDYSRIPPLLGQESLEVEEAAERREIRERISLRRHAGEEEEEEEEIEVFGGEKCEGRGGGRFSVCVPPKNALLLMRSRSDPVRVSALASRFWEVPAAAPDDDKCEGEREDCDHEDEEDDEFVEENEEEKVEEHEKLGLICKEKEAEETEPVMGTEVEKAEDEENPQEENVEISEEIMPEEACQEENQELAQENQVAEEANQEIQEAVADPESLEAEDALLIQEGKQEFPLVDERVEQEEEEERTEEENANGEHEESQDSPLKVETEESEEAVISSEEREEQQEQEEREATPLLPDCLLLMRCEPKLSMEVSKETWVCTTDFIRWLPERPPPKARTDRGDEPKKKKRVGSGDVNPAPVPVPAQYQPPRWSCSLPAAAAARVSVAARMEQRVVGAAVGYEPLGLTRCKSEPNRTAAAKLKPESCFWKNRRLEPHSRAAAVGGGAAGVGF